MPFKAFTIAVCICMFGICIEKSQATIIVSGDVFISYALNPISTNTFYNPDNQQFFLNVLEGATKIGIIMQPQTLPLTKPPTGNELYAGKLFNFYNSVRSIEVTEFPTITATSLENVGMLFAPMPYFSFSSDEITALNNYIDQGGSVFFLGESNTYPTQNSVINQTLADIGSSMRISSGGYDRGKFIARGDHIATNDYTSGVASLTYGFVSGVSGGTALFSTNDYIPFIAYEEVSTSIPEPTLPESLFIGLLFLFGLVKRNSKN
jgi:hypothetical protein